MSLFLYIDLFKNIVTIDGQKYDVQQEAKEGYEPYQASDGRNMYRKLVGVGGPEMGGGVESSQEAAPEPEEKDPLKQGDKPSQGSDIKGAKKMQEENPTSPFSDPTADENMDPMEHYRAANLAAKLGDDKVSEAHRSKAKEKTTDMDGTEHADLKDKLRQEGFTEDADYHHSKVRGIVESGAQEHLDSMDSMKEGPATVRQGAAKKEDLGTADTVRQEDTQKEAQKKATDDFKSSASSYEDLSKEAKESQKNYEGQLKDYEKQLEEHKAGLSKLQDRMQSHKEGKPVKDDAEVNKLKKEIDSLSNEIADHSDAKPDGKKLQSHKDKIAEHATKSPTRKSGESDSVFERRAKAHANRANALKAQTAVLNKDYKNSLNDHKDKLRRLKKKQRDLRTKHTSAKEKMNEEHKSSLDKYSEKLKEHQRDLKDHNKAKDSFKEPDNKEAKAKEAKAKEAKAKEAKATKEAKAEEAKATKAEADAPKSPVSSMDRAALQQHSNKSKEVSTNIQTHLDSNPDLSDEDRSVLEEMLSKLEDHGNLRTVPTKEQEAELKQIQTLTKNHSSKEYQAEKAPKDIKDGSKSEKAGKESRTSGKKTTGSIKRMYEQGVSAGGAWGSAAADPYGGAGSLASSALNAPGHGVASGGHWLLNQKDGGEPENKNEAPKDGAPKQSSLEETTKSLRLYILDTK